MRTWIALCVYQYFIFWTLTVCGNPSSTYDPFVMDAICRNHNPFRLRVSTALRIIASRSFYPSGFTCRFILYAEQKYRLHLRMRNIDMTFSATCAEDWLRIYEIDNNSTISHLTAPYGLCGNKTKPDMKTDTSPVTQEVYLDFKSGNKIKERRGFELIVTAFVTDSCAGRFICRNRKCIDRSLRCDRYNNCGDGSDEERNMCQSLRGCDAVCRTRVAIGVTMGLLAVIAIVTTVLIFCYSDTIRSWWTHGDRKHLEQQRIVARPNEYQHTPGRSQRDRQRTLPGRVSVRFNNVAYEPDPAEPTNEITTPNYLLYRSYLNESMLKINANHLQSKECTV